MSRPVSVMSVAFKPEDDSKVLRVLHGAIHEGLDLIVLPETCAGNTAPGQTHDSHLIVAVREAAQKYRTNIVLPIYMRYISHEGEKRVNTALVINREGEVVASYRKIYPYWSEFDVDPPCVVTDGGDCAVELDFGKIGLAICFDANFPSVWQNLHDLGAELVVWSSAYSAGMQLAAYSLMHHYPIITCTQVPDVALYDIDGREVAHKQGSHCAGYCCTVDSCAADNFATDSCAAGNLAAGVGAAGRVLDSDENGACVMECTIDLDRCIFHYNFNQDKAKQLIHEHGADIEIERDYWREQWFIMRSNNIKVNVRELAPHYGMTELNTYQKDSKKAIDAMRISI